MPTRLSLSMPAPWARAPLRAASMCGLIGLACSTSPENRGTVAVPPETPTTRPPDSGQLPPGVEAPLYSGEWTAPSYAELDDLPLPEADDGRGYVWLDTSEVSLRLDPTLRDPVTAAAACGVVVLACHDAGTRNYHGCLANGPQCASDTPWTEAELCCPASCVDRYIAARSAGLNEPDAVLEAIYGDTSCIPGLVDARTGGAR